MQATIYITPEAMATVNAIKDLDYHDRLALSDDDETDLTAKEGYHLIAKKLKLAPLPADAHIAANLAPAVQQEPGGVSMPAHLRGCIFERAPHLPDAYAGIVTYWSGLPTSADTAGAAHYQCPQNEYMVKLLAETDGPDLDDATCTDSLLSEGVVASIAGLGTLAANLQANDFIEIRLPVDPAMLGVEPDEFRSSREYAVVPEQRYERIFLKVEDIRNSPAPDTVFIDVLRHELLDYGYFY